MSFSTLIRFFAAIFVLSAFAGTLVIAKRALLDGDEQKPATNKLESLIPAKEASAEAIDALLEKLEVENIPDVTPGERAFESARDLLEKGDYVAAEEKLKYVNTYYPTAFSTPEARRILGEMNMDRLFSGTEFSTITEYKVKRGDSFYKIVRECETNIDLLMFLNDMTRIDRLHPGDTFKVMKLDFRLVVDLKKELISIWSGPQYIKGYPILSSNLAQGSQVKKTSVVTVEAKFDGKRVNLPNSNYRNAEKVIVLKSPQAEIRPFNGVVEEGIVGLYLSPADIEELALLLRAGNSVEIRY